MIQDELTDCPNCDGEGYDTDADEVCSVCDGEKEVPEIIALRWRMEQRKLRQFYNNEGETEDLTELGTEL